MYTMKDICAQTGLPYETLRFYCNEGLIPNVKRDKNNYRIFGDKDLAWIKSLQCLKKCGMSIHDMKEYINLCIAGERTIEERKIMLNKQKKLLREKINEMNQSIDFINEKQAFYDGVLDGKIKYKSNLIDIGS